MRKRSIKIAGHATSISLEDEFWDALNDIAESKSLGITALIELIDKQRKTDNLSSAIRLYVLDYFRKK
ncbi:MAG TPA: hypothetical protein EYG18_02540 [Micavibrio sp.]|nr:hypothetical protein [Micavibrio sp.]HIL28127.1 hypothetical protein [Micavibrio sp.]